MGEQISVKYETRQRLDRIKEERNIKTYNDLQEYFCDLYSQLYNPKEVIIRKMHEIAKRNAFNLNQGDKTLFEYISPLLKQTGEKRVETAKQLVQSLEEEINSDLDDRPTDPSDNPEEQINDENQ